jgi:hypothetical protein
LLNPDVPFAPNFYTVLPGATPVDTSITALGLGPPDISDDGVVTVTPGFTFPFPGGSTTSLSACANGYVWLGTNALGDFSPAVSTFLGSMARLAVCWNDQHCGRNITTIPNSGMYVNTDLSGGPGNGVTYVTWLDIGQFANAALSGLCDNTFQAAIHENGVVEFRYGAFNSWRTATNTIVGFSRGAVAAPANNPGSRDL